MPNPQTLSLHGSLALIALLFATLISRTVLAQPVVVWANTGEDKVTRDELRATQQGATSSAIVNTAWDGTRVQLFGARNEVVAFNVILEAESGATNLSVSFNTLNGPNGAVISSRTTSGNGVYDYTGRQIELFFVRYLQIKGVSRVSYDDYDQRHAPAKMGRPFIDDGRGTGGWADRPNHDKFYPDIAVPLELVPTFSIPPASNQSIWTDIYVPPSSPPGLYAGRFTVRTGATVVKAIPVELEVLDFTLPDLPASKTMIYLSASNINQRYFGATELDPNSADGVASRVIRDRHYLLLHRHRLSGIGDDAACGLSSGSDRPCPEWDARLSGSLFTSANGYEGPGLGTGNDVYSIHTYGHWPWKDEGESGMRVHTDSWELWFAQHAPDIERFLYLIDESPDTAQIELWARWMANNPGPGRELRSFATMHLPTAALETPALDIPASSPWVGIPEEWEPRANAYTTHARKRFYWYNGHRPGSGSFATEDEGTALREVPWGQYKKRINRWFFWESTYYNNYQGSMGETNVFRTAQTFGTASEMHATMGEFGWNYSNGDGVLMYPGTDRLFPADSYGVMGPFASLRLKFWRRGVQDVEYLELARAVNPGAVDDIVNAMIPTVLWEYGVNDPNEPSYVHTGISWPSDPGVWEAARRALAGIIAGSGGGSGPQVAMTNPSSGATLSGSIALAATATDSGGIAGVQFLLDGSPVGSEDTSVPYGITLDTSTVADGSHAFSARARNSSNMNATSSAVVATISNHVTTPGALTLVAPLLTLVPSSPHVGQTANATFSAKNTGGQPVSVAYFFAAARNPSNANVDFPVSSTVTLQPGQEFTYNASQAFGTSGSHSVWPAYFDGTNWIDLGGHSVFTVSASTVPSTTRLEEDSVAIALGATEWSWNHWSNASASSAEYIASIRDDATLSFTFAGTGIRMVGTKDSCSGLARVEIDGSSQTIDTYNPTLEWQATLFSVTGLAETVHTFSLAVLGTQQFASCAGWISIDAFDIGGTAGGTLTRFEEDSATVIAGPTEWSWNMSGKDTRASDGGYATSSTAGATLTFPFNGTGVSVIGITDSCSGQANVDIDGVSETVDAYRASGDAWQQPLFLRPGLPGGSHTLRLTVLGTQQAASCGPWIYVDAFDVTN